jgi:hypothetical protein
MVIPSAAKDLLFTLRIHATLAKKTKKTPRLCRYASILPALTKAGSAAKNLIRANVTQPHTNAAPSSPRHL